MSKVSVVFGLVVVVVVIASLFLLAGKGAADQPAMPSSSSKSGNPALTATPKLVPTPVPPPGRTPTATLGPVSTITPEPKIDPTPTLDRAGLGRAGIDADREALTALYEATDGAERKKDTNWTKDNPLDEWWGVTTDGNGRVIGLWLPGNGLNGSIPPSLGNLSGRQGQRSLTSGSRTKPLTAVSSLPPLLCIYHYAYDLSIAYARSF